MTGYAAREHHGILTTPEAAAYGAANWGDHVALRVWRDGAYQEITRTELSDRVDALALGLISLGVRPKNLVALLGENRPEWAIGYLGIHRAGATVVPLDSLLTPRELRPLLIDSAVSVIIVSPRFVDDILELKKGVDTLETVICMDDAVAASKDSPSVLGMDAVSRRADGETPVLPEVTLDDLAALIYTSGTTGKAKGVMLSQRNIMSDVALSGQVLILGPGDNFLSVLPLHHTFECTAGFLVPMYWGASITYARSLKSRDIIDDARNTGATYLLGVPLLFEKMMQGIQRKLDQQPTSKKVLIRTLFGIERLGRKVGLRLGGKLFHSLREKAGLGTLTTLIAGGAALPEYVASWFSSLGFDLSQGYGLSETSPIVCVPPAKFDNPASVGPAIPEVEVRIDNPDDEGHGEICVRGPIVMMGYYRNDEATREVIDEDGWLHTGDIGCIDKKGFVYISGRMKNVLVTPSGKNVYPEEIEHVINQCPTVLESMVYGTPTVGGEEVRAYVVPDPVWFEEQGTLREKPFEQPEIDGMVMSEVQTALADVAEYKRPRRVDIRRDEFEKTSTKKIKRFLYATAK